MKIKYDKWGYPYRSLFGSMENIDQRIHRALKKQDIEILCLFVEKGLLHPDTRVNSLDRKDHKGLSSYDDNGHSLLHETVRLGRRDWVELLLKSGANPNIKTFFGETPMLDASKNINLETMVLLFEYGGSLSDTPLLRGNYADDTGAHPLRLTPLDEYNYRIQKLGGPAISEAILEKMILKNNLTEEISTKNTTKSFRKM